ncbi:MAG TPA: hypothetical protein VER03_24150 [Bryobacteraceae bacterium]|nr:hypothetical protein [Bryobacteraceae bacterium]
MDTRTKIVPSFAAPQATTVIGYFDPMHAGHVRRLQEICATAGSRISVIVADPREPILPTQARAELVAALDCVAFVLPAGAYVETALANSGTVIDERMTDAARSRTFAQHVLSRHNTK